MAGCSGRVNSVLEFVEYVFNDTTQGYLQFDNAAQQTHAVRVLNQCTSQLAKKGWFKKRGTVSVTADTSSYDLLSALSDCIGVLQVFWESAQLYPIRSVDQYESGMEDSASGTPEAYMLAGTTIHLVPTPDADGSLVVWYQGSGTDVGCDSSTDFPVPPDYDDMYAYYLLYTVHLKDESDETRVRKQADLWYGKYQEEMKRLLASNRTLGRSLKPYR